MKLLSAKQIKDWDQFTILHEPITSIDLMERAAFKCVEWLEQHHYTDKQLFIFCGKGNNGGDGLAIARMLSKQIIPVSVYILETGQKGSEDFQLNLIKLQQNSHKDIHFIQNENAIPVFPSYAVIIDALFGSGLNRPVDGVMSKLIEHINRSGCEIISIDVPSGLFIDSSSKNNPVIKARHILSIQSTKLAFLISENADYIGQVHNIDIGLKKEFFSTVDIKNELIEDDLIRNIYKHRAPFTHKGNFGHALLVAGSYGKMGAVVLAAEACIRSGVGLLTCHIPQCGYIILQTALPEAMTLTDFNSSFITHVESDLSKFNVVGIGPGLGTAKETRTALKQLLQQFRKPVVIDADGLNCISLENEILATLPPQSILTPHPREFDRLFGISGNDFERIEKALLYAKSLGCVIILKSHHTFIATPSGKGYFNNTGNAGMATGGSGDVLTGILTGILAQGYSSVDAAIIAVYLHGLAGDLAARNLSQEALIAGDITDYLGKAFLQISTY
ncbi:MAG: NAD(P)H-hydrate dehydratase [Bacteroidetes bacterium]|nr:NAD(P)H-hydrate dehydratase [Bacteroidota bacterium]MBS1931771.1 NAD(P)H-hydrate dehydratase [Bacteroidota bacterium]